MDKKKKHVKKEGNFLLDFCFLLTSSSWWPIQQQFLLSLKVKIKKTEERKRIAKYTERRSTLPSEKV